jgi:hypothetical protein
MALPGESAEQRRGVIPRRVRGMVRTYRCQSIKWLGRGSRCGSDVPVGASSEADLTRGGAQPSNEADLTQGGAQPSIEANLTRGGAQPSSEADLARGGGAAGPRARRTLLEGVSEPSV